MHEFTQFVRDYIFYMKVHVDGDNYAHLRVFQGYPGEAWQWPLPELQAIQYVKPSNATIEYFDSDSWIHI